VAKCVINKLTVILTSAAGWRDGAPQAHENTKAAGIPAASAGLLAFCVMLVGCETSPQPTPASHQQADADMVVSFQSWHSISFIKPEVMSTAGTLTARTKTFASEGFVKLLNNLKTPREFVVVVLDRRYSPDPATSNGGLDAIERFFAGLGFRRIVLQDGTAIDRNLGQAILRDTTMNKPS
jgi:hypothetical protein